MTSETAASNGNTGHDDASLTSWLTLAGIAMGFALGTKYLALIPLILIALLMRVRGINTALVARYLLIASVIGSPWYLKNTILMRNPVYPFYYRVFPSTRYWSEGRELAYRSEQGGFGYPHSLAQPRETLINLLEMPWRTLADAGHYFNRGEFTFSALFGGMFGGLVLAGLLLRRHRSVYIDIGILATTQFAAWFFVAQVGRYLIQILPLFALLGGIVAIRLIFCDDGRKTALRRAVSTTVFALLIGNVALILWSVTMLPSGDKDEVNRLANTTGMAAEFASKSQVLPTALSLGDSIDLALHPDKREQSLGRRLDVYDAEQYVNQHAKPGDGVILFEDTRGFYLDRPYLWGNDQHSTYIPYGTFRNGADVTNWMNGHGIRYAIINLRWSSKNVEHRGISVDEAVTLLQQWYIDPDPPAKQGDWYRSVGEAIRDRFWTVEEVIKGNVVLAIGPSEPRTGHATSPGVWRKG